MEWSRRHRHRVPGYSGGWSSIVTTDTVCSGPNGHVLEVAGTVVVGGERRQGEQRPALTGASDALARSWAGPCTLWSVHGHAWAPLATSGLVVAMRFFDEAVSGLSLIHI